MADPANETFGWRFFLPEQGDPDSHITFPWIIGIADEIEAYKSLASGARSMPASARREPITVAEALNLNLKRGDARRETMP